MKSSMFFGENFMKIPLMKNFIIFRVRMRAKLEWALLYKKDDLLRK